MQPQGKSPFPPPELPQVSNAFGFWKLITPSANPIDPNAQGIPCDGILVDTAAAVVTGKPGAVGGTGAAIATPALATGQIWPISFYSITVVSAGNVWAFWYRNPN